MVNKCLTLVAIEVFNWFQYFEFFKKANFSTHFGDIELEWAGITSLMAEMREEAKSLREEMAEVMARPQQPLEAHEEQ